MLFPKLEARLRSSKSALAGATSANIIELQQKYLALLAEYRAELYQFPRALGLNQWSGSYLWEDAINVRKAVRAALEHTACERTKTETLLLSFTAVSGYEAVATLNRQKYKGHDDWQLSAGGAGFRGSAAGERMSIPETVELASLLRREEYITRNAVASHERAPGPCVTRTTAAPAAETNK